MIVVVLLLVLGGAVYSLRRRVFETSVATLLLSPVIATVLVALGFTAGVTTYGIIILAVLGLLCFVQPKSNDRTLTPESISLVLAFCVFYGLSRLWPDFISIGERLRDYALLSSVIDSPAIAKEPWMHGSVLNYYLYWYRFGRMLGSLSFADAAQTYHLLVGFSFALFFATIVACARTILKLSGGAAVLCGVIVALGSNVQGVFSFLERNSNWWGPSRILDGGNAINEFPAWSFVLGDAHPHYLNLTLLPFFLLLFAHVVKRYRFTLGILPTVLGALVAGSLWVYGANAWEMPAWSALVGLLVTGWIVRTMVAEGGEIWRPFDRRSLVLLAMLWLVAAAFIPAIWNITPADAPPTRVAGAVQPSVTGEFLRHWGVPIALLVLLLPLQTHRILTTVAAYMAALLFLLLPMPFYLISLLLLLSLVGLVRSLRRVDCEVTWLLHATGAVGLILILFPELYFFDDPYGDKIERMNTIFKFYSAAWAMIHLYALGLAARRLPQAWRGASLPAVACGVLVTALLTGFFLRAVQLRKIGGEWTGDISRGLRTVEREFPGSSSTILFLDGLSRDVVLEAQGGAYTYASFVSTLSNHDAYLGWSNHVNLLVRDTEESKRREEVTKQVYTESECRKTRELLQRERIGFVVVGELERRAFPALSEQQFSCLTKRHQEKGYAVYSP